MIDNKKKSNYTLLAILSYIYIFIMMISIYSIKIFETHGINTVVVFIISIILIIPFILIFSKGFILILKLCNFNIKETKTKSRKASILKMICLIIVLNLAEGFLNINNINSEILQMAARSFLITIVLLIIIRHYETKDTTDRDVKD